MLVVVNVYYISQMKLDERDNRCLATATNNAKEKRAKGADQEITSKQCYLFVRFLNHEKRALASTEATVEILVITCLQVALDMSQCEILHVHQLQH